MQLAFLAGWPAVLLLLKKRQSVLVFAVSLAGYVILYIGDITEGVFAAIGTSQVVILSLVVAIAAALFGLQGTVTGAACFREITI